MQTSPGAFLKQMLSTDGYITVSSALAEYEQRAAEDNTSIGEGMCGTIYPLEGTTQVIKIPKSPEKSHELWQDAMMHNRIEETMRGVPSALRQDFSVPAYGGWVAPETSTFWDDNAQLFPPATKVPNFGLISERILPLPLPVRTALVDALCSKAIKKQKEAFLKQPENKDCLVRLYLGRRVEGSKSDNVRLRNFPLHVNDMEHLKLDTRMYATTMARALATMHWAAGVDANDVEFVLGSSPCKNLTAKPTMEELEASDMHSAAKLYQFDLWHRAISIWLLDFNQCKKFEHNAQGLKQLVDGFYWNDPYYPRPGSRHQDDKHLWEVFRDAYLEASDVLGGGSMARDFVTTVEVRGSRRSGGLFG